MQLFLQAALEYAARGWKVLPLKMSDKVPILASWQTAASDDEDQVAAWWEATPKANVGVQLGPRSGIVDIEFDDEEGRATAGRLFGELYTPTFSSGKRSVHRLFRWSPELPSIASTKRLGLEIRIGGDGKGAQSVFPPSRHPSGSTYQWVPGMSPSEIDVMDVPNSVLTLLANDNDGTAETSGEPRGAEHWERILAGVDEGSRNNDMASLIGLTLRKSIDLDSESIAVVYQLIKAANSLNRPPLDENTLKITFQSILKKEKQRRLSDKVSLYMRPSVEQQVDAAETGKAIFADMKLVCVLSDPKIWRLYAEQFHKAPGGFIELTSEQLASANQVRVQALEQAQYGFPAKDFAQDWGGSKGLYVHLTESAEEIEAPLESKRKLWIAAMLLEKLDGANHLVDGSQPRRGGATRLDDGSIVFTFQAMLDTFTVGGEKVKRTELSDLLKRFDAKVYRPIHGGPRFRLLPKTSIDRLREQIAEVEKIG